MTDLRRDGTSARRQWAFWALGGVLAFVPMAATLGDPWGRGAILPLPFFLTGEGSFPGILLLLGLPIGFWLLLGGTKNLDAAIGLPSMAVFGLTTLFSWLLYAGQLRGGIETSGPIVVTVVGVVNLVVPSWLLLEILKCRARPSWWRAFAIHWVLFAWIGSFAFAWTDWAL